MTRFLQEDVLPIFAGAGRSSLTLAAAFHAAFGCTSLILEPKRGKASRFARYLTVQDRALEQALGDIAREWGRTRRLLLYPGTLAGARALAGVDGGILERFFANGALLRSRAPLVGDGMVTGYLPPQGRAYGVFSRTGRVLSLGENSLPRELETCFLPLSAEEVLQALPADYVGFFTVLFSEGAPMGLLPLLIDGGFLFERSGIDPASLVARSEILWDPQEGISPEEGEAFAGGVWQDAFSLANRIWPRREGTRVKKPRFLRSEWDRL